MQPSNLTTSNTTRNADTTPLENHHHSRCPSISIINLSIANILPLALSLLPFHPLPPQLIRLLRRPLRRKNLIPTTFPNIQLLTKPSVRLDNVSLIAYKIYSFRAGYAPALHDYSAINIRRVGKHRLMGGESRGKRTISSHNRRTSTHAHRTMQQHPFPPLTLLLNKRAHLAQHSKDILVRIIAFLDIHMFDAFIHVRFARGGGEILAHDRDDEGDVFGGESGDVFGGVGAAEVDVGEDFVHGDTREPALEIAFEDRAGYFLSGGVGGCHVVWERCE